MRRILLAAGALMLLLPLARGQDEPKKAANPAKAIIAEFDAADKEAFNEYRKATTPEERSAALKKRPNPMEYASRLMAIAKADPKSEAGGDALIWVANMASRSADGKAALGLIIEHHAASAALTPAVLDRLASGPHPQMEKFLTRVAADNPSSATKEAAAAISRLLIGKVVPDIAAEDLDGKPFKLSDYRGKVVLLDFWGHW
jgi:AhpC/TSA family